MITANTYIADRYEILGKIGAGGMSDVYKAKDLTLGRFVAIKVLKAEYSEDMNFVTKFRTEAQSAAGLEHPNIVNIYDVGSENGIHYIVMEYVEGITLKLYIEKKGRLSFKEAISIAIQVGRGIEAAHAKNIVHRDIKPQNIIISTEGKVKVTDFGIARAASANTINSDVMGSVHYASPEQARNGFVDGKSDIYSLGIVMYEMVTGRVPFDGDTTVAVAIQHLQEEMVKPSTYAPDLPISLEKIILKCTQKNPDRRYESVESLLADLRRALVSPEEDFVVMAPAVNQDKTRVIKEQDIDRIKRETEAMRAKQEEEAVPQEFIAAVAGAEKEPEFILQEDENDSGDEIEDDLNPRMEKAITIMGIAAGIVIIAIIIFLVVNVFGNFRSKDSEGDTAQTESQIAVSETSNASGATDTSEDAAAPTETTVVNGVEVPSVAGMTYDEAKKTLNDKGLGIREDGSAPSDKYGKGLVVSQDPAETTLVEANTTVNVILSSGKTEEAGEAVDEEEAEEKPVPNVIGQTESAAVNALSGFEVHKDYSYSDSVAAGIVMSQTPAGGSTAKAGDTVTLSISRGSVPVTVPDVTTTYKSEDQAREVLKDFHVTAIPEYSSTVPEGIVISQSIAPGKQVERGIEIIIKISKGPEPAEGAQEPQQTQEQQTQEQQTQPTSWKFNATIKAPADTTNVSGADIFLYDADGNLIEQWLEVPISSFGSDGYSISKTGISTSTGELSISWLDLDSNEINSEDRSVTFTSE